MTARIYISSTFSDLAAHRAAAARVLRRMGHQVVGMEDYAAADERPLDKCLRDVGNADIYIGVFAWRYGFVPTDSNPRERSITELEYRHAKGLKKPRLIFLADSSAAWPVGSIDGVAEHTKSATAVRKLRRTLEKDRTASYFTSPESLANEVAAAVGFHLQADSWLADAVMTAAAQGEIGRFSPTGAEAAVKAWRLGSSLEPELKEKLLSIVEGLGQFDYAIVDLGRGESWWSTRLFLLAAMASDYTDLDHLVFLSQGRYIGTATTREIHLKLSRQFPRYERAYRRSRPLAGELEPHKEIVDAIEPFSIELGQQYLADGTDDEWRIKDWVRQANLQEWLGTSLHSDSVEDPGEQPTVVDVYDILSTQSSHVALLRNGKFRALVDRDAVALGVSLAVIRHRLAQTFPLNIQRRQRRVAPQLARTRQLATGPTDGPHRFPGRYRAEIGVSACGYGLSEGFTKTPNDVTVAIVSA